MSEWGEVELRMRLLADMIKTRPCEEWARSLVYILVCLEERPREEDFKKALVSLRDRIDTRLSRGTWSG